MVRPVAFAAVSTAGDEGLQLHLHAWRAAPVVAVALTALASGFGQFGAVAALGNVARAFGHHVSSGTSVAAKVGLSGTELGVGLALIRLASLGALPVAAAADRLGRRPLLLGTVAIGLLLTAAAASSPGYWWFVALFALGRPALSATNAVAQVAAAEQTTGSGRARAVALVAAGYAVGAGAVAILNGLAGQALGFRGLFLLALVPLVLVLLTSRHLEESSRFATAKPRQGGSWSALRKHPLRRRLVVTSGLAFAVAAISGPATGFTFVYAQNVLRLPGWATSVMVIAAGATGLGGLLVGRHLADHWGRRPTSAVALVAAAATGIVAYSGGAAALVGGYVAGVGAAAVLAPALGTLVPELFPTPVRAAAVGFEVAAAVVGGVVGLVVFGAVADAGGGFAGAAIATFTPAAALAALAALVPETAGADQME